MSQVKRSIRLENTEGSNNKYYEMHDNGDGSWMAYYARIGYPPKSARYSVASWEKKYNEKIQKGYVDVTEEVGVIYDGNMNTASPANYIPSGEQNNLYPSFHDGWMDPEGKYDITGEKKSVFHDGETVQLWRIVSLRDFVAADGRFVKRLDIGGWVQHPHNLQDDAWVADEAMVLGGAEACGNSLICGHAQLGQNAKVMDRAQIKDQAFVTDSAKVYGDAVVYQNARVSAFAIIHDRACIGGKALVTDNAEIKDDAWVCGTSCILGSRVVGGTAFID